MIVKCISALPTLEQAKHLGEPYRAGRQTFGISPGNVYVVFALKTLGGQPWVDITDPDRHPGYLFSVPLVLFELVDARVSVFWEARITSTGELKLAPPSLFREFYYDDLFEEVREVVDDFLRVREQMEHEAATRPRGEGPA